MRLINPVLFDAAKQFLAQLSPSDRVAVIHHTDPDGVCSGVIAAKTVEQVRGKEIDLRFNQPSSEVSVLSSTVDMLRAQKITHVITTDIAVDDNPLTIRDLATFAHVLIIDHHKIKTDLSIIPRVIFYKPQLAFDGIDPSRYCSAKMIFDLGSTLTDLSSLDFVSAIACIADVTYMQTKDFVDGVFHKYGIPIIDDVFLTDLGRCAQYLSHAEAYDIKNVPLCYSIVSSAKKPSDILDSQLKEFDAAIAGEVEKHNHLLDTQGEKYPDIELVFYVVESPYNIKSNLSTISSMKRQHTTIFIASSHNGMMYFSARRQDRKIAVNDLIENCTRGLSGASGGGHIPAAGGKCTIADWPAFKRRVVEELRGKYGSS